MNKQRDMYALAIQTSAQQEIENLRRNQAVTRAEWAFPLEAAPAAVCTMAILLKTASDKKLADMEVQSQVVRADEGRELGLLPYKQFLPNLEHCGQLGQSAFRKAEEIMALIEGTAHSMIRDGGSISSIIELLEDMESAKTELIPVVEGIEKKSNDCLDQIQKLCRQFEYWYWVICCLKTNAVAEKGQVQGERKERELEQEMAKEESGVSLEKEATARRMIEETEARLKDARAEIERAREEVEKLAAIPLDPGLSSLEELAIAEKAIAAMEPVKKEGAVRAVFKKAKTAVLGENDKEHQARADRLKQKKEEYIAEEKARRAEAHQRAADRLKAAKENEDKLRAEIEKTRAELMEKLDKHLEARNHLKRASEEFKRLGKQKGELKIILEILSASIKQLAELKNHVNQLVKFFNTILVEVTKGVTQDVADFLDPVKRGAEKGSLGNFTKKKIVKQSLHIQSSFSAIMDISGAFVYISNKYIGPAIQMMEALGVVSDAEWNDASEAFAKTCQTYMKEIEDYAKSAGKDMPNNIQDRIEYLGQFAIDVASESPSITAA